MSAPSSASAQPQRDSSASAASASSPSILASSPLQRAPVTTLALICRCLDARSLLSVAQSCRALAAAAMHPLTYQHAIGISVDSQRGVQLRGPSATFRLLSVLSASLRSHLMHHMRLLTLRPTGVQSLQAQLRELHLLSADHPLQLHALTLDLTDVSVSWTPLQLPNTSNWHRVGGSSAEWQRIDAMPLTPAQKWHLALRPLFDLSLLLCTRYLKALLLTCSAKHAGGILQHPLPPTVELLQLRLHHVEHMSDDDDDDGAEDVDDRLDLSDALTPMSQLPALRSLIVQSSDSSSNVVTTLDDLYALERVLVVSPQLELIHWLVSIDLRRLEQAAQQEGRHFRQPLPRLPKVFSLICSDAGGLYTDDGCEVTATAGSLLLALFPDVTRLTFSSCTLPDSAETVSLPAPWPPALSAQLVELCITEIAHEDRCFASLAQAKLVALQKLSLVGSGKNDGVTRRRVTNTLAAALASMPQLIHLSIKRVFMEDLVCFRHAPKLLSLRGLEFPYTAQECDPMHPASARVKQLHRDFSLATCFPSLQTLHVGGASCRRFDARHLLLSIPTLTSVAWCLEATVAPSDIDRYEAHMSEKRAYLQHLQERYVDYKAAEQSWKHAEATIAHLAGVPSAEVKRTVRAAQLELTLTEQEPIITQRRYLLGIHTPPKQQRDEQLAQSIGHLTLRSKDSSTHTASLPAFVWHPDTGSDLRESASSVASTPAAPSAVSSTAASPPTFSVGSTMASSARKRTARKRYR